METDNLLSYMVASMHIMHELRPQLGNPEYRFKCQCKDCKNIAKDGGTYLTVISYAVDLLLKETIASN